MAATDRVFGSSADPRERMRCCIVPSGADRRSDGLDVPSDALDEPGTAGLKASAARSNEVTAECIRRRPGCARGPWKRAPGHFGTTGGGSNTPGDAADVRTFRTNERRDHGVRGTDDVVESPAPEYVMTDRGDESSGAPTRSNCRADTVN